MSALRKLERSIAKNNGIAWSDFKKKKYVEEDKDGSIVSDFTPKNTMKKKRSHFDNCKRYFAMFDSIKESRKEKEDKTV